MKGPYIQRSRTIPRREFLRGAGVALALPLLECMRPAFARERSSTPHRMLVISNNLGVLPKPFFPESSGPDYDLSPYLEELKSFRQDFTVFSGLSHPGVVGGHSTENCFLTAAKGPTRSGFRNQISLDQFAAESLGQQTRFATLNLGVNIEKAKRSLAWTRDGSLLPPEDSPSALFTKMFAQGSQQEVEQRLHELRLRGSILDAVSVETRQFSKSLGRNDRDRLDQYLNSVRELERRLHVAGEWERRPKPVIDRDPPTDILDDALFFEKFKMMLSMARLALETDSTRIVTLMLDAYETGVFQIDENTKSMNGYHNLSHHGQVPKKVSQLETVDRRQMSLLRNLLTNLSKTFEGSRHLLDSTMILYGSNMGDANTHDNTNLPIFLAGGGFRHGQHLAFDRDGNTPLSNLFLSMLHRMGVETDAFGSSSGTLNGLEASA
jgi:hypothetical protein